MSSSAADPTITALKLVIFWDIVPCSPHINQRFGRMYHLHLQGWKPWVRNQYPSSLLVSCLDEFLPWRQRWYVPTKCWFTYRQHSTLSQKMTTSVTTAVRTSNPTSLHNWAEFTCKLQFRSESSVRKTFKYLKLHQMWHLVLQINARNNILWH
jgi:hypothetical protein